LNQISIPSYTEKILEINEIFYSIQGESTYAGLPFVFIRLSKCNLNCEWCDTKYANTEEGSRLNFHEIYDKISKYPTRYIEITGGEPLLQKQQVVNFVEFIFNKGYRILIETNGSINLGGIPDYCIKIVDVKTPSSGHVYSFNLENLEFLNKDDQIKFVIKDREDFEYSINFIEKYKDRLPSVKLFSPVWGSIDYDVLSKWILEYGSDIRLQLQFHKIIWDANLRGV